MALTLGSNIGFVSASPSADPESAQSATLDSYIFAMRHTSPAGSYEVTEIGFWASGTYTGGAYKTGLYTNTSDLPGTLLEEQTGQSSSSNGSSWYKYTGLSISLTSETTYWIAAGHEAVTGVVVIDRNTSATGEKSAYHLYANKPSIALDNQTHAIFAKYEAVAGGTTTPVFQYYHNQART